MSDLQPTETTPGSGPESNRTFLRLTFYNILANVTAPLAGVVDLAMLGHLSQIRFLAGVALGGVIFDTIYWALGFLRMATTALAAQAVGRGHHGESRRALLRALALAIALGLILLATQDWLGTLGFHLLAGEPEVESAGRDYFDARIWGAPAYLANLVILGWFLGKGQSRLVLVATAVGNLANIGLNYVFIMRLGWAAHGAGVATSLSQYLILLLAAAMAWRQRGPTGPWRQVFSFASLWKLLRLQWDILLRTLCLILALAMFTNGMAALGTAMLAASSLLTRLFTFAAFLIDGAAYATETIAGQLLGSGDTGGLRRLLSFALIIGLAFASVFTVALLAVPGPILGLLTTHQDVVDLAISMAPWLALTVLLGSPAFIYDGFFLGITAARTLRNAMLICTFLVFVPAAMVAQWLHSAHLLWLALVLFMASRVVTLALAARRLHRGSMT